MIIVYYNSRTAWILGFEHCNYSSALFFYLFYLFLLSIYIFFQFSRALELYLTLVQKRLSSTLKIEDLSLKNNIN